MSPMSYDTIDKFLARVRKASVSGGKSINLTIEEATDLTAAMAQVLLRNQSPGVVTSTEVTEVEIQGGSFK